ncbi:MAG TPA: cupin domain-containing protein [Kofleriaceae bacterium]|jgi:quercetin dioxygenase-like cupin family protein|nr:cupin domain-containing protein [Kofleriaceae bacterium]
MSKRRWYVTAPGLGAILLFLGTARAQPAANQAGAHSMAEMKFAPVAGLPTCVQIALESGDPAQGGFVALAKAKTGCTVPWHWHPGIEQLMFVDGTARVHMKDAGQPVALRAGGFAMMPSHHVHEFQCTQACTFFLYSDQKFDIHYVDPQGKQIRPEDALKPVNETAATAMK